MGMTLREAVRVFEGEAWLKAQEFRDRAQHYERLGALLEAKPEAERSLPKDWWSYPPSKALLERFPELEKGNGESVGSPRVGAPKPARAERPESERATWTLDGEEGWLVRSQPGLREGSEIEVHRRSGGSKTVKLGPMVREVDGRALYRFEGDDRRSEREAPAARGAGREGNRSSGSKPRAERYGRRAGARGELGR